MKLQLEQQFVDVLPISIFSTYTVQHILCAK